MTTAMWLLEEQHGARAIGAAVNEQYVGVKREPVRGVQARVTGQQTGHK
jgi:hypothetical protein